MFDACATPSMTTPRAVTHDPAVAKYGRDELGDAAIAVGKDPAVVPAELLDNRAAVVDGVVAIARPARGRDDARSRRRITICALHEYR